MTAPAQPRSGSGDWTLWLIGAAVVAMTTAKLREAVAPPVFWAAVVSAGVLLLSGLVLLLRQPTPGDPLPSLATRADLAELAPKGAARTARRLRPSLQASAVKGDAVGVPLGYLEPRGPELRASWESTVLTVMAPRSGKTTRLAVPILTAAPGGVIATSNKRDLLDLTWTARSRRGSVWTFDPQAIAGGAQTFTVDLLAGVDGVQPAHRLASHFLSAKSDQDFWDHAATELLTGLFLAAAVGPDADMATVYRWLTDSSDPEPAYLLDRASFPAVAGSLRGMQAGAAETTAGIVQNARTAAAALRDPEILRWVTPQPGLPVLDAAQVVTGATLYALSKDGAGSAAPLVAGLVDAVFRAGIRAAELDGGRLDPPLVAVLDECANTCRIADLPLLYSHLGSRGIVPVAVLQSYRQGENTWGPAGMSALWSAATVKLIGPGIDDAQHAEDLSRLVGDHDVSTVSRSRSASGMSESVGTQRRRILSAAEVRAIKRGRALLFVTGAKPAMIRLKAPR